MKFSAVACGLLLFGTLTSALAQSDLDRARNLANCLDGRYPALCKRSWLSSEEQRKVEVAERRENLKVCLTGRYPALCRKTRLTADEMKSVQLAERAENLKTCMTGRYKTVCKREMLTDLEKKHVLAAEAEENLKTCLSGRYPTLCDRALLTGAQRIQVQAAEKRAPTVKTTDGPATRFARRSGSSGCESGHWIDSVSSDGSIVKLEDGSVWQVDAGDTVDSSLWLPVSDIVACDDKLINTDDNESVGATRIR